MCLHVDISLYSSNFSQYFPPRALSCSADIFSRVFWHLQSVKGSSLFCARQSSNWSRMKGQQEQHHTQEHLACRACLHLRNTFSGGGSCHGAPLIPGGHTMQVTVVYAESSIILCQHAAG